MSSLDQFSKKSPNTIRQSKRLRDKDDRMSLGHLSVASSATGSPIADLSPVISLANYLTINWLAKLTQIKLTYRLSFPARTEFNCYVKLTYSEQHPPIHRIHRIGQSAAIAAGQWRAAVSGGRHRGVGQIQGRLL